MTIATQIRSRKTAGVLLTLALLALSATAFASLGGDESSVQTDQQQMKFVKRTAQSSARYTVHELRSDGGPVIREYVSPAGRVFGVAWQTSTMPNLQQLLGSYYDQFRQAVTSTPGRFRRRGPVAIELPGLVVQSGGHMRAYVGRAYDPTLLPSGVSADEIK
jgi:hypothetical protein